MNKYDKSLPESCIIHCDINGMYSYIMSEYTLPHDEIQLLSKDKISKLNVWDHNKDSDYGFILYVDVSNINITHQDKSVDLP